MTDLNDFGSAGLLTSAPTSRARRPTTGGRPADASRRRRTPASSAATTTRATSTPSSAATSGSRRRGRATCSRRRPAGIRTSSSSCPQEGVMHWTDNMMIPMHAANPQSAIMWMDFYYQPEVAARVAEWVELRHACPGREGDHRRAAQRPDRRREPVRASRRRHHGPRLPGVPRPGRVRTWNTIFGSIATKQLRADRMRPRSTTPSDLRPSGAKATPNRGWRTGGGAGGSSV